MGCLCRDGFLWGTNLCVRDCSNDTNTKNYTYDESNIGECQCAKRFIWNVTRVRCVRNCKNDTNSNLIYDERNVEQCKCKENFRWDRKRKRCLKRNRFGGRKFKGRYGA
jgi:hypothetical protein